MFTSEIIYHRIKINYPPANQRAGRTGTNVRAKHPACKAIRRSDSVPDASPLQEHYNSDDLFSILSFTNSINSSTGMPSWRVPSRLRNDTVPSAISLSPTTSM